MAKRKTPRYSHPGGVLGVPRRVLRSPAYRDLSLAARCLMLELQDVWKPSEPIIHYSARRAANALNKSINTAALAFNELSEHGFIECVDDDDWFNGKARTYRLTWLSDNGREPTNEWMWWSENNKSPYLSQDGQPLKRPISRTVDKKRGDSSTKNQQLNNDTAPITVLSEIHH